MSSDIDNLQRRAKAIQSLVRQDRANVDVSKTRDEPQKGVQKS